MPVVEFVEVGRNNVSWSANCKGDLTYEWLYKQVKKHVLSTNIEFSLSGSTDGVIYAGFYTVGSFKVLKEGE